MTPKVNISSLDYGSSFLSSLPTPILYPAASEVFLKSKSDHVTSQIRGHPSYHRRSFMIYNPHISLWPLVLTYSSSLPPITHPFMHARTLTHTHTYVHIYTYTQQAPLCFLCPECLSPPAHSPIRWVSSHGPFKSKTKNHIFMEAAHQPSLSLSLEPTPCGARSTQKLPLLHGR